MAFRSFGTFFLSLIMLWAFPLQAQNTLDLLSDVPPPDEWRFISTDDATSKCIGDPKTPLCAVETDMACLVRADINLCKRIGINETSFTLPRKISKYRIIAAKVLTEKDITRELQFSDWWKPGFVNFTIFWPSTMDQPCQPYCNYSYTVNPVNDEWHVIAGARWGR